MVCTAALAAMGCHGAESMKAGTPQAVKVPSHPWEHLQQPLTGGDSPEPISTAKLLGLSHFFLPVPLLDGKAENWGRQFGKKRSHHLCHRKHGISFPAQPVLAWVCSSVSNIVGEWGTDGVRGSGFPRPLRCRAQELSWTWDRAHVGEAGSFPLLPPSQSHPRLHLGPLWM